MDVDNGQRYELRLTSEDVSNIVDGDILVTSVDNVEVWMALLNKVTLEPVTVFTSDMDADDSSFAPPPADLLIPHAPDAAARPTVASGHRQRRSAPSGPASLTDHSDVLNAFAGSASMLEGPSEPSVPNIFPAQDSAPKKGRKGVKITVEVEEEDNVEDTPRQEKKTSNWKPPQLTPKPPSNRKQSVSTVVDLVVYFLTLVY